MKKTFYLLFCARSVLAATSLGGVWSAPLPTPSTTTNALFVIYDTAIQESVGTWINSVDYPAAMARGFSSNFNGSSWSSPLDTPVNGIFSMMMFEVPLSVSAYNATTQTVTTVWHDASAQVQSSTFDGSNWGTAIPIPGAMPGLIPFIGYDAQTGQSIAVWSDFTNAFYSIFDGTNWSASPQMHPAMNAPLIFPTDFSGQFVTTWVESNGIAYSSTFDGSAWGTPVVIATNVNFPNDLPLFGSSCSPTWEQLLVTWSDNTTHQGYSSLFDNTSWSAPMIIPNCTVPANNGIFSIYNPVLKQVVAVWLDEVTGKVSYSEFDGTSWTSGQAIPDFPVGQPVGFYSPLIGKVVVTGHAAPDYDGFYSILTVSFIPPAGTLTSKNAQNVATYLNTVGQQDIALQQLLATLNTLTPGEQNAAVESISNSRNASVSWEAASTALGFNQTMANHGATLRTLAGNAARGEVYEETAALLLAANKRPKVCVPCKNRCPTKSYGIWVDGLGVWGHQNAESGNPAFNAMTGAGLLGFDYYGKRLQMVTALMYGRTHVKQKQDAGSGNINSYGVSLLGTGSIRHVFVEGGVTGVYNQNQSKRHVVFPGFDAVARASFHSWQVVPHLALGYDIERGNWTCEPFISGDCAILFQEGFAETGAAPLNMAQPASTSYLFEGRGGVRAYYTRLVSSGVWFLKFSGAYQYKKSWGVGEIANAFIVGQPAGFTVISLDKPQNGFVPALEFFYRGNNGFFTSLAYEGEFAKQAFLNTAMLKLGYAW